MAQLKLISLTDDLRAVPAAEIALIPEFRVLVERDRDKRKSRATRELAYIYHTCYHGSPYAKYERELREEKVRTDLFGSPEWEPDEVVEAARRKFLELTETALVKLLKAAMNGIHQLEEFFNDTVIQETKEAKDFMLALSSLSKVIEGVQKLQEQVEAEQSTGVKTRGGVVPTKWNE